MSIINRMGRLLPDLSLTVARFPVPFAVSVLAAIIGNLDIAEIINLPSVYDPPYTVAWLKKESLYGALVAAFLASGAAHLFAEARRLNGAMSLLLALVAGAAATVPFWFVTRLEFQILMMFWLPGLVLLVMVAGYLRAGGADNAIWIFNARLALAIVLATVVGLVFFLGLVAIVESVEYLFSIRLGSDSTEHILCTAVTLVGPVFGLSMVSRDLSEPFVPQEHSGLLIAGSSLLLNYLLIPIAVVYVAILYLYAGRILLNWELPRGQIGFMVLLFAIGGTGVWLIAQPWRQGGSALLRIFQRTWFWLLTVPLGLLFVGLFRRVSDYGVTPERYGLALVGLWAAVLVIGFALRSSSIGPRLIIGSLSALLLVASFGPWGADQVSVRSQFSRLIVILQEAGYLSDGKIGAADRFDTKLAADGRSIVFLLSEAGRLDLLAPLFAGRENDPFSDGGQQADAGEVLGQLQLKEQADDGSVFVNYAGWAGPVELALSNSAVFSGGHRFGTSWGSGQRSDGSGPKILVNGTNVVVSRGDDVWQATTKDLIERARAAEDDTSRPLIIELEGQRGQASLIIFEISGWIRESEYEIESAHAVVLLPR
ncbi:DUF4153 domain-containing protein [Nitratireductor sp. XY-223]|uniref:DUF4153 domain-containing protein n=1 Tax=Nitratireductor sp. XY-223 TaxID=2561926 RepID=UPI00145B31E7|nr:DUF4153 domain-containing protein [Nitratireductor sp. XY-223]